MRKTQRAEAGLKEKGVLASVTTWMNLEDITASEITHMRPRGANSMISRIWTLKQNSAENGGCQGRGEGRWGEVRQKGGEFCFMCVCTRVRVCVCMCVRACACGCLCVHTHVHVYVHAKSCPTLCDPTDCSPPGSSVHGIPHAKILEWTAISSSRASS